MQNTLTPTAQSSYAAYVNHIRLCPRRPNEAGRCADGAALVRAYLADFERKSRRGASRTGMRTVRGRCPSPWQTVSGSDTRFGAGPICQRAPGRACPGSAVPRRRRTGCRQRLCVSRPAYRRHTVLRWGEPARRPPPSGETSDKPTVIAREGFRRHDLAPPGKPGSLTGLPGGVGASALRSRRTLPQTWAGCRARRCSPCPTLPGPGEIWGREHFDVLEVALFTALTVPAQKALSCFHLTSGPARRLVGPFALTYYGGMRPAVREREPRPGLGRRLALSRCAVAHTCRPPSDRWTGAGRLRTG